MRRPTGVIVKLITSWASLPSGVSKLARLVDMYARRLQLQERLTEQISQQVMELVGAKGVGESGAVGSTPTVSSGSGCRCCPWPSCPTPISTEP